MKTKAVKDADCLKRCGIRGQGVDGVDKQVHSAIVLTPQAVRHLHPAPHKRNLDNY